VSSSENFDLLSARHEKRTTVITSNLAFSEWHRVFGDEKLTAALLDRLAQYAEVLAQRCLSRRAPVIGCATNRIGHAR